MNPASRVLLLLLGTLTFAGLGYAKPWWMRGVESNGTDFLAPDVAFRVSSHIDGSVVRIRWVIADGYYLYRQKMAVAAESPDLVVTQPVFPRGTVRTDAYFGAQEIFTQQVEATVPFTRTDGGAHPMQVRVTYQGCAEAGLCYPAITKVLFPTAGAPSAVIQPVNPPHPWMGYAIVGGLFAFLLAGLLLRRGRNLALPV
jgi:thiol:disulfide interchange protein DsbD